MVRVAVQHEPCLDPLGSADHLHKVASKLIGQMALTPEPEFPNVPTVAETIPGISAIGFMNLAAPAATPRSRLRSRLDCSLTRTLSPRGHNDTFLGGTETDHRG